MAPFYEWSSTASRLPATSRRQFTFYHSDIPGTHSWQPVDLLCKPIGLLLYDRTIACKWVKGSSYQLSVTFLKQKSDQSLKISLQPSRMGNAYSKSTRYQKTQMEFVSFVFINVFEHALVIDWRLMVSFGVSPPSRKLLPQSFQTTRFSPNPSFG